MSDAADAIVVLGARALEDGRPGAALRRRTAQGVVLYHAGFAPFLVLSGGPGNGGAVEAGVMRDIAAAAGVPADAIVLEPASRSTFENAVHTARLARDRGWSTLIIVTERYHLPRALFTFRRTGLRVTGSAAPSGPPGWLWAAVRLAELGKWPWYLWRASVRDRAILRELRGR